MKPLTLFIIFLVCFSVSQYAQAQERAARLLYENSGGEKGISFFEYDGNLRLIKGHWQLIDTSRWSTNYYLYNENGQLAEKYREFSDNMTSSLKYSYTKQGLKATESFSRSDGREGTSTFIYSPEGKLKSINCHKFNGWFDGKITVTKYQDREPVLAQIFQNEKEIGTITYEYERGNLVKEYWDLNGAWSQTFVWKYKIPQKTFTSSNVFIAETSRFRLAKENYSFNNETGGPSYFKYAESGKLMEKVFVRSDSLKTKTSFEYDKDGILKKSTRHYSDGKTGTFTYDFNKNRKIVSRLFKRSDGVEGSEKYEYNPTGKLSKAVWKNFDNWLSGIITFEYNRAGLISKGLFKGEDGINADLNFFYDENGNLTKIVWNFSFGKTQTYWFEYTQTD